MKHVFTLEVSGIDPKRDDYEDTLFEAGCDDAVIAVIDDTIFLDFDRAADSFDAAVKSATQDIERAGAHVVRVMPTPE